jgi:solute carrier family 25 (adenine nucleotide translocator) protein 4/5/6/31
VVTNARAQPPTITPKPSNRQRIQTSLTDAFAGAGAGALAKTVVAPIERVKLLMQLQKSIQTLRPNHASVASAGTANAATATATATATSSTINISGSAWNVARTVYKEEGILAFWRGNTPNVLRQGGAAALNFMLMDWYKYAIAPVLNATLALPSQRPHEDRKKRRKIISSFLSGGLAGGTTTTVLYPIEFMRTRLALDLGSSSSDTCKRMYPRGMRDVFCTIWKTDGWRGMYQGYGIALTGVVLYRALHLGGYDACKTELLYRRKKENKGVDLDASMTMGERFMIAQIVSIVAGTICYPIDSVRRRLMMQAGQPGDARLYSNSIHAFQRIFLEEGVRGFYLGIGPNLMRSFGGALLLVAYDVFKGMVRLG